MNHIYIENLSKKGDLYVYVHFAENFFSYIISGLVITG